MFAVSYARSAEHSPAAVQEQHEVNTACAERDGYTILPEHLFSDDGVSGVAASRPDFERMLQVLEQEGGRIGRVYMRDRTRLGRGADPRQHIHWENRIEDCGAQVCYTGDEAPVAPLVVHLHRWVEETMASAMNGMARERLIRDIKRGHAHCALRGYYPGSTAPYGTERWLVDTLTGAYVERIPDGASRPRSGCGIKLRWCEGESIRVVQSIFRWVGEEGFSVAACARRLNEQDVLPPARVARWSRLTVRRLLANPLYCGDLVWGRSFREGTPRDARERGSLDEAPLVVPEYLPGAPISRAQFEHVQQVLRRNARARTK